MSNENNVLEFKSNIDPVELIKKQIGSDKIVIAYMNEDGTLRTYLGDDLTLIESLFVIDTIKRRIDAEYPHN